MAKNNLLLVDLNDKKTKKLAETITSDTSRKILNHLAEKDDSEANIAKSCGIPISTVHYHLQKLQDAGLVTANEYHYSEKGREINHYKLANKYIIIAPRKISGLKEKLKNILPVALVSFAAAGLLKLYTATTSLGAFGINSAAKAAPILETASAPTAEIMAVSQDLAMETVTPIAQELTTKTAPIAHDLGKGAYVYPDIALWFLIGAVSAMIIYVIWALIKDWKNNR